MCHCRTRQSYSCSSESEDGGFVSPAIMRPCLSESLKQEAERQRTAEQITASKRYQTRKPDLKRRHEILYHLPRGPECSSSDCLASRCSRHVRSNLGTDPFLICPAHLMHSLAVLVKVERGKGPEAFEEREMGRGRYTGV